MGFTSSKFAKKRYWPCVAALVAGHGSLATAAVWSSTRNVDVQDPQYQVTAYTLEVPAGWKHAGTVARDTGCHASGPGLKDTMQSPDGQTVMAYLPGTQWVWTDNVYLRQMMDKNHCPAVEIDSAVSFLINIALPNRHPKAAIVSVLSLDAEGQASLAAQLDRARQQNTSLAARFGQKPQKLGLTGARVRVRYIQNGKPMEEEMLAVVDCFETQYGAMYAQPAYSRRACSARSTVITRAPQGRLDELLASQQLQTLRKGAHVNSEWMDRLTRDQRGAFQRAQAQSDLSFANMMQKSQQDHAQLVAQGKAFQDREAQNFAKAQAMDRATQQTIDKGAHLQVLDSLGRQQFKNPDTGQIIEASSYYNHQWMSSDGSTLIQADSPTLDPNGVVYPVSQGWVELVPN
jgi:hypothetical protein